MIRIGKWIIAALAVAAIGLAMAKPAHACKVTEPFIVPTNFELVQLADAIAIAKVEHFLPAPDNGPNYERIARFRTYLPLKGRPGKYIEAKGLERRYQPSDPIDISEPNPGAYGECTRYFFQKGRLYVMFLEDDKETGKPRQVRHSFSRVNEDVTDVDAFWVRVIKLYLDIQRDPDGMAQIARLRQLATELRSKGKSPENLSLLLDIETHLATMSVRKPGQFLLDNYRALAKPPEERPVLLGYEQVWERAEYLKAVVAGEPTAVSDEEAERDKRTIIWSLARGEHPVALSFFEELLAEGDVRNIAPAIMFFANNGMPDRARQIAVAETDRILSLGENRVKRWFLYSVPYEIMPLEYRLDLYWKLRESGDSYDPVFEIPKDERRKITPAQYRANEKLAIALATEYDEQVVHWALKELDANRPPEQERLPVLVILNSYQDLALARQKYLFCAGGHRREFFMQGLANMYHYPATDWLVWIGRYDGLTAKDREIFAETLARRKDGEGYLETFLRGEKLPIPKWDVEDFVPLNCN